MALANILIVDDEPDIREVLSDILEDEGYAVHCASDAKEAETMVHSIQPDLVFLDVWMPGEDGLTLYRRWAKDESIAMPVIMISGHGTIENAVEATQLGAYDFLEKPLSTAKLLIVIRRALETHNLKRVNAQLEKERNHNIALLGDSAEINQVRKMLERIAPTEGRVFIEGESGCGKGIAATAIHQLSSRSHAPCLHLNLAGIPKSDIPMRLFGIERDGVISKGQFELAQGGTLVLDEVGDLDDELQTQLARVLEAQSITRLGGTEPIDIDVRIIATSSHNMASLLQTGRFQHDLYHRLNVLPLRIPSLRDRLDDIEPLTTALIQHFVEQEQLVRHEFEAEAFAAMKTYHWPGNIRELRNFVQRVLIMIRSRIIGAQHVQQYLDNTVNESVTSKAYSFAEKYDLKNAREQFEKQYFENLIKECEGNMTQVAKLAGVERTHLYRKLKTLGVSNRRIE